MVTRADVELARLVAAASALAAQAQGTLGRQSARPGGRRRGRGRPSGGGGGGRNGGSGRNGGKAPITSLTLRGIETEKVTW